MRRPIIIANWKMEKTSEEAVSYAKEFKELVKDVKDVDIVLCPSFTSIYPMHQELKNTNISLGSQNLFYEEHGAFTGEISAKMLKPFCRYSIIGHSERREHFNETNEMVNKKIKIALEHGITPLLCFGEEREIEDEEKLKSTLKKQLEERLKGINDIKKIIFAYEPAWAISKGDPTKEPAKAEKADRIQGFVREILKADDSIRVIYGASVKPDNISEFMSFENIDGALVGGASLDPESFSKIVKFKR